MIIYCLPTATRLAVALLLLFPVCMPISAQWKPTGGPIGRQVTDIEFFGDSVFATDLYLHNMHPDSSHWLPVGFTGMPFITGIESTGDTLYGFAGDQVRVSFDAGRSWEELGDFPSLRHIDALERMAPGMFFGGHHGVVRSTDNGATWIRSNDGLINSQVLALGEVGDILLAGTQEGIYHSNDSGATWTRITGSGPVHDAPVTAFASLRSVILAATGPEVHRSLDSGRTWAPAITGLPPGDTIRTLIATDGELYAGTASRGVHRSDDLGLTWTAAGLDTLRINTFAARDGKLFAGTMNMGIFRSTDRGASWQDVHNGIANGERVHDLAAGNGVLYAAAADGPYTSRDAGAFWRDSPTLYASNAYLVTPTPTGALLVVRAGDENSMVFVSRGEDWEPLPLLLPGADAREVMFHQGRIYVLSQPGLLRYDTTEWSVAAPMAWSHLVSLDTFMFGAAESGLLDGIYRMSSQGGTSVNNGLPSPLVVDAMIAGEATLYLLADNYLYWSDNLGDSWNSSTTRLGNGTPSAMVAHNDTLYVSVISSLGSRVMRTTDLGDSWQDVSRGLERLQLLSEFLSLAILDSNLYLGTGRSGVWKRPLADMAGINTSVPDIHSPEPFVATLAPNPASESVSITAGAGMGSHGTIELFDQLGRCAMKRDVVATGSVISIFALSRRESIAA